MDESSQRLLQRRRSLLALSPPERVKAMLSAPRPAELVRSLSAQDLFLTLMEGGLDQALPLLRHASRHQMDFLVDLEGWGRERFSSRRMARWLARFREADPEIVARWLEEGDEATVVLALSRMIAIHKLDPSLDETRWPPEKRIPSLDGVYFLQPREGLSQEAFRALWEGLALVRAQRSQVYEALLEQALWAIPAEQEETAYQERESRLAERGFPEFEEALGVWAAGPETSPAGREAVARKVRLFRTAVRPAPPALPREAIPEEAPNLLPAESEPVTVLSKALLDLPRDRAERVIHDIVRLGNRFAVASLAHLGRPQTHHEGFRTALCHSGLGLALLAAGETEEFPPAALEQLSIWEICAAGTGAVLERAQRARRLARGWLARAPLGRERLDAPLKEALRGLEHPRPHYRAWEEKRPFREIADLEVIDEFLDAIEGLGAFVEGCLGGADLPEQLPWGLRRPEELEWSATALTAAARELLGDSPSPRPLDRDEALRALESMVEDSAVTPALLGALEHLGLMPARRFLEARLLDAAAEWNPPSPPEPARFKAFLFRADPVDS